MTVDPDRHLSLCQMLTEGQNRLRHLRLELRAWGSSLAWWVGSTFCHSAAQGLCSKPLPGTPDGH